MIIIYTERDLERMHTGGGSQRIMNNIQRHKLDGFKDADAVIFLETGCARGTWYVTVLKNRNGILCEFTVAENEDVFDQLDKNGVAVL